MNTNVTWGGGVATDCWCANSSSQGCLCDGLTEYSANFACNVGMCRLRPEKEKPCLLPYINCH